MSSNEKQKRKRDLEFWHWQQMQLNSSCRHFSNKIKLCKKDENISTTDKLKCHRNFKIGDLFLRYKNFIGFNFLIQFFFLVSSQSFTSRTRTFLGYHDEVLYIDMNIKTGCEHSPVFTAWDQRAKVTIVPSLHPEMSEVPVASHGFLERRWSAEQVVEHQNKILSKILVGDRNVPRHHFIHTHAQEHISSFISSNKRFLVEYKQSYRQGGQCCFNAPLFSRALLVWGLG